MLKPHVKKIGQSFLVRDENNRVKGVHVTKKAAEAALLKLIGAAGQVAVKAVGKAIKKAVDKGKAKKAAKKAAKPKK